MEGHGIEVKTAMVTEYPVVPVKPERSMFKIEEDFEKVKDEYNLEVLSYNHEVDEIESKIEKGEIRRHLYRGQQSEAVLRLDNSISG